MFFTIGKYALPVGAWVAATEIIPVIGAFLGAVLAVDGVDERLDEREVARGRRAASGLDGRVDERLTIHVAFSPVEAI